MNNRVRFLGVFIFLTFVMKVVGELVHEVMGHGFFILLFGGEITRVRISLLWPYELSSITLNPPPGGFEAWQLVWIAGGGILVCLLVSCVIQALLLFRIVKNWPSSTLLLWLSFWTFLNPTGYLIIGGIKPFGDVAALIEKDVLTQEISLVIGLLIFAVAFFSISKILMDLLLGLNLIRGVKELRVSISLFWLVVPIITAVYCLGTRQPLLYLQIFTSLSFAPVLASFIILPVLVKKSGEIKSQND